VYTAGAGAGWAAGLTNLTTTANLGAAFAGGVVGSLASQAAGNLLGVMDGFDLKGALVSGITTMATAGFSGALGSGGKEAVKGFSTLSESTGQVALTAAGKATVAAGASIT
ncbi:hypothetical protein, partial [Rheinheimera faecalis]|uniref:hypothetical protein n=1 Tax=Rheinheimera faecalis TaxID=2901141 RepID=UPI001E3FFFED